MRIIEIDGKKYKLIPIEESVLDGYEIGAKALEDKHRPVEAKIEDSSSSSPAKVKDAIPIVSDYRERYKQRKIRASEITAPPRITEIEDKTGGLLDGYNYKGESLFFGEGLTIDHG